MLRARVARMTRRATCGRGRAVGSDEEVEMHGSSIAAAAGHRPGTNYARTMATQPAPGWYDDGSGKQRWWDGTHWTGEVRYSGQEQDFAGVVIDGRWIHFGDLSQPVSEVAASADSGDA